MKHEHLAQAVAAKAARRMLAALLASTLAMIAAPRAALAQADGIVVYVEGPDAETVRRDVVKALPAGIKLADEKEFHVQLLNEGQKQPLGKDIDPAVIDRIRRAARIMGVPAAVVVRVRREHDMRRVLFLVVPAWKKLALTEETTLALTSHDPDVAMIAAMLGPSLRAYASESPRADESPVMAQPPAAEQTVTAAPAPVFASPAPPPPEQAPPEAERAPPPARTPAQIVASSIVDVALAGGIEGRRFDYRNGIDPDTRRNTVPLSPAVGVSGQLFPLTRAGGVWSDIGIVATYTRIFSPMNGVGTVAEDITPSSYAAGLRVRIHPGSHLIVGLSAQYAFATRQPVGPAESELPDVTYRSVRTSVDARVSAGPVSLLEEVGFRAPVDTDGISTRFYAPEGRGLDAAVGAAVMLAPWFEARLVADYEIESFAFTPPAGTTIGPGNARDQLYGAHLALAVLR